MLTFVEAGFSVSGLLWIQLAVHQRWEANRWLFPTIGVLLYLYHDWVLVRRGRGAVFEKEFRKFGTTKRIMLYLVASGIVLASGMAAYLAATAYRRAGGFH